MARATSGCAAVWRPATRLRAGCSAVWRGAHRSVSGCAAVWESGAPVVSGCAAAWDGGARAVSGCAAVWQGRGERLVAGCAAAWDGGETPTPPDPTPVDHPDGVRVLCDDVEIDPVRISLTWSRERVLIEAELELPDEARPARHRPVSLELWGYTFNLVVDGRSRSERFGSHAWTIRLVSPAVALDSPWAKPVEGELTGQASVIAARLAGDIPLAWRCVDWRLGPGRWIAAGTSPRELLQTLATATGAALTSDPDGGLRIAPLYPVSPPDWPGAEPAAVLTVTNEVIGLDLSDERREGVNAITVTDAGASQGDLRIEDDEATRTATTVELLVYQIPWTDEVDLSHRGDPRYAALTPLGVEDRVVEDEEIIIDAGEGRARHPIYAVIAARYNWVNLGVPTYSEDGSVKTAIRGESIMLLSYRTRARRFLAREARQTDLLVVARDGED